jgi:excisionase family DNA binding protein
MLGTLVAPSTVDRTAMRRTTQGWGLVMTTEGTSQDWAGKKIFTTGEAAQICKVSQQTIIRCFDAGRLQGFRVPGSKFRRIPREELIRFMKANAIPTEILDAGRKRVLVVDDDPGIVQLFVDVLSRDGRFDVQTATSGYDAGMLTESFRPHLIVLDYMLPDLNGNVVCQRVRSNSDLNDTRIIFVSGVVNQQEVQQLLAAGADAFFKKPFELAALLNKINELLGLENGVSAAAS